jgi:dolichyl-phosphate-mannose-protein mannosyltransferase
MGRILYFHHYFPALLFSSMMSGVVLDFLIQNVSALLGERRLGSSPSSGWSWFHVLYGGILSAIGYSFYLFSPLAYGAAGPLASEMNSTMYGLKWLESWEF